LDWGSPIWRHWLDQLGQTHTVLRYDERGCGLSEAGAVDLSVDRWVGDLEAVVDAAGLERFVLLGVSQGAAIGAAYSARHPTRVTDLVLYGGYARGRQLRGQRAEEEALIAAIRAGWASDESAYRHLFTLLFVPGGTTEQMTWYDELLRSTTSAEEAVRLFRARGTVDVIADAGRVQARTLVMHARDDRVVPVEEGRLLAALIPQARLSVLDSPNHILLADEPAWEQFLAEFREFVGAAPVASGPAAAGELSPREQEVMALVAAGLTNEAIAGRLVVSTRTVERHLSNIYAKLRVSGRTARAAAAVAFIQRRATAGRQRR
jgi:pimeloyl-ACP methyl ester carboxylesterase/DNA-binding CsgD family transcriptional regulator